MVNGAGGTLESNNSGGRQWWGASTKSNIWILLLSISFNSPRQMRGVLVCWNVDIASASGAGFTGRMGLVRNMAGFVWADWAGTKWVCIWEALHTHSHTHTHIHKHAHSDNLTSTQTELMWLYLYTHTSKVLMLISSKMTSMRLALTWTSEQGGKGFI